MEQTQASETSSLSNPCPDSPVHAFWAPLYLLMKGHCFYNKELDMCARGKTTTLVPEGVGGWQAVSLTTPSLDFDPPIHRDPHSSPSHYVSHTHSATGTAGNMPPERKAPSSPNPKKPVTRKSKGTEPIICVGVDKCKNAPWTDELCRESKRRQRRTPVSRAVRPRCALFPEGFRVVNLCPCASSHSFLSIPFLPLPRQE